MNLTDPDRSPLVEARMILQGLSGLHATSEHLRALDEAHEVRLIKISNALEKLKKDILNGVEL